MVCGAVVSVSITQPLRRKVSSTCSKYCGTATPARNLVVGGFHATPELISLPKHGIRCGVALFGFQSVSVRASS